jgi:hypothetical protein
LARAIAALARDPEQRAAFANAAYERLIADFTMPPGIARLSDRLTHLVAP